MLLELSKQAKAEDEAKVPRRTSGEPTVKTAGTASQCQKILMNGRSWSWVPHFPTAPPVEFRNRFLSVLGALDPSKVKDLDLGSARDMGPKKALPRVKAGSSLKMQ